MKKLSVILAVLLALTMLPAVGASAAGQNLIQNGDFETPDVNNPDWAANWDDAADAAGTVPVVDEEGNEVKDENGDTVEKADDINNTSIAVDETTNNKYLLIENSYAKAEEVKQRVSGISKAKDYVFSLRVNNNGYTGKALIYYRDSNGDKIKDANNKDYLDLGYYDNSSNGSYLVEGTGKKGVWSKYVFYIKGADLPNEIATLEFALRAGKGSSGTLSFDDIYFGEASSEVTYTEDEETDTIAVSYDAYLPSSYEGDAPSIVAIAALYKTDGGVKSLVSVSISDATALTKGAHTTIDLGSFDMPTQDADKYSVRVFSLESLASLEPFDTFEAHALATPAA